MGVIIGDRIVVMQGRPRGLDPNDVKYMNARIVIGGFIVAHLVSVIFYFPERIAEDWTVLFNPFAGLSSFGGFLGAFLAFLYFTKKAEIPRLPYADSVALGLSIGWIFGRTGCFTAHDHPGRHVSASFFLSVNYPEGPRIDLGLYELLFTIVMTAILFAYNRKPRPPGRIIAPRGAALRAGALRARFPARDRRDPPRPALSRAHARAVGLPGDRRASASTSGAAASPRRPPRPRLRIRPRLPRRPTGKPRRTRPPRTKPRASRLPRARSDPRSGGAPRPDRTRPGTPSSS